MRELLVVMQGVHGRRLLRLRWDGAASLLCAEGHESDGEGEVSFYSVVPAVTLAAAEELAAHEAESFIEQGKVEGFELVGEAPGSA
jgi:hypothetical protein